MIQQPSSWLCNIAVQHVLPFITMVPTTLFTSLFAFIKPWTVCFNMHEQACQQPCSSWPAQPCSSLSTGKNKLCVFYVCSCNFCNSNTRFSFTVDALATIVVKVESDSTVNPLYATIELQQLQLAFHIKRYCYKTWWATIADWIMQLYNYKALAWRVINDVLVPNTTDTRGRDITSAASQSSHH